MDSIWSEMSCGSGSCGLMEINPKQTTFSPCLSFPPPHFILPLLSRVPLHSILKEIPVNWMPRAEFLAKIICWQRRAASCCKHQVFRQEGTSLVFMGMLDQPLAFGCLSCMLSTSLPRWRGTDLLASVCAITLVPGGIH